ncbi:MAG: type VI secretion system protein TssA [Phycisphaerales bacterium]|nr:type VI secretion system protein TssA [Phycisphaerales bacterium]
MSSINVDALLKEISAEEPCGPALNYDPAYLELESAIKGKPEQVMGDTIIPAEEPDWKDVRSRASELAAKTRDLRVILYLTVAATKLDGLPGLRDGLAVLKGAIEKYWDKVHPQMDPSDNDPMERTNIIAAFAVPPETFGDTLAVQRRVMEAPLAASAQLGRFGLRDIKMAAGEIQAPSGIKPPDMALVEGAFKDTKTEDLQASLEAGQAAADLAAGLDAVLTEKAGSGNAPDLSRFLALLKEVLAALQTQLAKRGIGQAPGSDGAQGGGSGGAGGALSGQIMSSHEVLLALDMVCRYYEHSEVSSPVPLLVKGAQRLVSQNFMEIAKVLTPDTIDRLKDIAGIKEASS